MPNYVLTRFIPGPVGGGGSGTVTGLSGDVTGSGSGVIPTTLVAITGPGATVPVAATAATFTWAHDAVTPGWAQAAATAGAGASMHYAPQAGFVGVSGSFYVDLSAPASGTAEAGLVVTRGGTAIAKIGQAIGYNIGQLWLSYGVAPTSTNWIVQSDGFYTSINAATRVDIDIATSLYMRFQYGLVQITQPMWNRNVGSDPSTPGDGFAQFSKSGTNQLWVLQADGTKFPVIPGGAAPSDGYDGAIVLDGVASYGQLTGPVLSSGIQVYSMVQDLFPTTLVINSGCALLTAGYAVFASKSITVNAGGLVYNAGENGGAADGAGGGTGGTATASATIGGGSAGGAGGINAAGTAGTNGTAQPPNNGVAGLFVGGAGGAGNAHAGGAGGTHTEISTVNCGGWRSRVGAMTASASGAGGVIKVQGGSGGGGGGAAGPIEEGGGGATEEGGGGGAGGGVMLLAAPYLTNGGTITVAGGPGGNGFSSAAGKAGGGGGGGGGVCYTVGVFNGTAPVVSGGVGGAAVNAGVVGVTGGNGLWVQVNP